MQPKPFFSLFILCTFLSFGCTKTQTVPEPMLQVPLSQDTHFIQLVQLEQNFSQFIEALAARKGLTIFEFKNKIESLNDNQLHSTKGMDAFNEFMGAENILYIKQYAKNYQMHWKQINTKYNDVSIQSIQKACEQLYAQSYNSVTPTGSSLFSVASNSLNAVNKNEHCGWRFPLCMAAATSGAILCHAACIGGTAGLGTPACILLCGTLQAAGGVACIDNYCPLP